MRSQVPGESDRSFRPQAFAVAACLTVLMASEPRLLLAAAREVAPPVGVPYAPQRKLLQTDFVRFEWKDSTRAGREIPVKIYFPTDTPGPFPVIVFSHGLGGTREGYEYLGRQWAANGYVVIHLQHVGTDDSAWRGQEHPMESMHSAITARAAIDRARDVHFAIDQLDALNKDDPKLKGLLDLHEIGMSGHSFGAQTTLMIAGQRLGGGRIAPSFADDRVKAALPMSASVPVLHSRLDGFYRDIKIPILLMTGTLDDSPLGDTKANERRMVFDHIRSSPAYLLTFNGADHMTFSGRVIRSHDDERFQKQIRLACTAFWDAYLKNDQQAKDWLNGSGLAAELGDQGTLERK